MTQTMRAVVADGKGGTEVRHLPIPVARDGWVVIKPTATGVCGTDLHLVSGDYPHGRFPVVPGHEFAGHVSQVGAGVEEIAEGDYVGVNPNISCGECEWCSIGATNLCEKLLPVGVAVDGSCAEYVAVPQGVVFHLPDSILEAVAPLIEPFSCVLHALERVPGWGEKRLLIFGAGSIGLMGVVLARDEGVSGIWVVELNPARRRAALDLGADAAVASVDDLERRGGFDLALDATGHPAAIGAAVGALRPRGRLIQMGVASESARIEVSPYEIYAKELTIAGSNSLAEKYGESVERMQDLQDRLASLVTGRFVLEEYDEAIEASKSPEHIKVQVRA